MVTLTRPTLFNHLSTGNNVQLEYKHSEIDSKWETLSGELKKEKANQLCLFDSVKSDVVADDKKQPPASASPFRSESSLANIQREPGVELSKEAELEEAYVYSLQHMKKVHRTINSPHEWVSLWHALRPGLDA